MFKRCFTLAAFALIVMLGAPADAQSPSWKQAGMLRRVVNPSIGFIIAGHQSMECNFTPNGPNPPQAYQGALNMVGLNIGISAGGVFAWRCSHRPSVFPLARWPANMSALREISPGVALAPTS